MANNPRHKENLKNFPKGTSGNPAGRPKLPDLTELLAKVLGEEKDGKTAGEAILMALRAKAAKGDTRAAEILLDRGWGKVKQDVGLSGDLKNEVTLKIVRTNTKS